MADPFPSETKRQEVGLPARPFFYTLEQISALLNLDTRYMNETLVYFDGRSIGSKFKSRLRAINISPPMTEPEWRISEDELIRWCRFKGVKVYERGWAQPPPP